MFVLILWCAEYGSLDQEPLGLPNPDIDDSLDDLHLLGAEAQGIWQADVDGNHPIYSQPAVGTPLQFPFLSSVGSFRSENSDLFASWEWFDPHVTNPTGSDRAPETYPWFSPRGWEGSSS